MTEQPLRPVDEDVHVPPGRRRTARDAIVAVLVAAALLVVLDGDGIRRTGEKMDTGLGRSVVLAVGHPAGWIADQLPFASAADQVTGWFSPDDDLGSADGSFTAPTPTAGSGGSSRVPPQAFSPADLGEPAGDRKALRTLLVTGDSMSQPLDSILARRLSDEGVRTVREPKLGTGISKPDLLDWGAYSGQQAQEIAPDAVVVFLGANEGFPMPTDAGTVECCDADWAAEYATRVRAMMQTYTRGGRTQVYWMLLPISRDDARAEIIRTVNAAIRVAAGPFGAQVRLVDIPGIFTPEGRYRDALDIGGREQIVRDADGIHLNERGGEIAADLLERLLEPQFVYGDT